MKKHELGTYKIDKISLSSFDDKRHVLDDGICALAYSHNDSITSCKEIKKDCDKKYCKEIKKDCDKKDYDKEDCDNSKIL